MPTSMWLIKGLSLCLLVAVTTNCGSGSGSEGDEFPLTALEGTLVDEANQPVVEAEVYLFETNESSITDDQGQFSIQSYKHLGSASIFFRTDTYSSRAEIGIIPDDTVVVRLRAVLDRALMDLSLHDMEFATEASPEPTPTPAAGATPGPSATPTPKPGNFDSNGNTSAFGIPKGMTGNISAGSTVWATECLSCHATEKTNRVYGQIKASMRIIPEMKPLQYTNQQLANVTAYLNRNRR